MSLVSSSVPFVLVLLVSSATIALASAPAKTSTASSSLTAVDHHLNRIGLLDLG